MPENLIQQIESYTFLYLDTQIMLSLAGLRPMEHGAKTEVAI